MRTDVFTPPASARALLGDQINTAIDEVDALRDRLAAAQNTANEYAARAENPDRFHLQAVRQAVARGGSSADVKDERAEWVDQYRRAREDIAALRPLLESAWRTLTQAVRDHGPAALPDVDGVITAAAGDYARALDAAEAAEARHREAMTVRRWIASAAGPSLDPFKAAREAEVKAGRLVAKPSEALHLLRVDAGSLEAQRVAEAHAQARREREARIARERAEAAAKRDRDEKEAAARRAAQRAAHREKELAATAAAEAKQIPGMPVVP